MLNKKFSDDWKWWVWTYVKNNKNKENLFTILLNNGYEWEAIQKELDYTPVTKNNILSKERQKALNEDKDVFVRNLNKVLADNPRCHRIESNLLEAYEIEGFISNQDCDTFIQLMEPVLKPSEVTNPDAEKNIRTSSTAFMPMGDSPFLPRLNQQLHEFMKIPIGKGESPQGQKYEVGQEFKPHCDWFDPNSPYNEKHLGMGQRTWTLMVYLNDVEEGGETAFTKINYEVKPKKGKALVWNNLFENGETSFYSEHWGKPVVKGMKYIVTKWFREKDGMDQSGETLPPSPNI